MEWQPAQSEGEDQRRAHDVHFLPDVGRLLLTFARSSATARLLLLTRRFHFSERVDLLGVGDGHFGLFDTLDDKSVRERHNLGGKLKRSYLGISNFYMCSTKLKKKI